MDPVIQSKVTTNYQDTEYAIKAAMHILNSELAKGLQSKNDGEVYTIEEAWEEIDKI